MQNFQLAKTDSDSNAVTKPSLPVLVKSLEQFVKNSEDDFMALGMNLQKIQFMSSNQRQKIAAAMGLFKANEADGVLAQITNYVQQSQQDTQNAQQIAADLCTKLGSMLTLMDSIAKRSPTLERAGLFLHVIGINTGIECARHTQMETMFKVVSQDTIALAEQIRVATNTLIDQVAAGKNEQQKTLAGAQDSIDALQGLVNDSKQATERALGKVGELIDYSISMVNEAEQMALKITSEINLVVMGIQFHDNLRQRIEHVNHALLETLEIPDAVSEEVACNAYLTVELQKAQLEQLVTELDNLYQTQTEALGNILNEVAGLEARLDSMASKQAQSRSQENPVTVLLHGITALEQLNQASLDLGSEINNSAEHAEQIANDMQTAIKSTFVIANNVKINALNAIIKAAKFGRSGESLQVLAQGMVTVSKDTRQLVTRFNELLDQLSKLAKKDDSSAAQQQTTAEDAAFDSQAVQQVFQDFHTDLHISQQACKELSESLAREQRGLHFLTELREALQLFTEQLGEHAASICPENKALLATMRSNFGQHMEKRYTMNEERVIHAQLRQTAAEQTGPAVVSLSAPTAVATDDCLFFSDPAPDAAAELELWDAPDQAAASSIELFAADPPQQTTNASDDIELWGAPAVADNSIELFEQPEETAAAAEIELWGTSPAVNEALPAAGEVAAEQSTAGNSSPAETEKPDRKTEDFGDNVELF